MVFLFVALRLWSVLGRRTGHEQPVAKPIETHGRPSATITAQGTDSSAQGQPSADPLIEPGAVAGVRAISEADREFDAARFVEGAQAAYRMILEAFWRGDEEELSRLTDDDVRDAFGQAIAARREAGHVVDNRLVSIERAVIDKARLSGSMAYVTVRFDADIAAVTRNEAGEVVPGSMTDAVPTHDVWTFSRHVGASDPNWILVEADEAA